MLRIVNLLTTQDFIPAVPFLLDTGYDVIPEKSNRPLRLTTTMHKMYLNVSHNPTNSPKYYPGFIDAPLYPYNEVGVLANFGYSLDKYKYQYAFIFDGGICDR